MSESAAGNGLLAILDSGGVATPGLDVAWLSAQRREAAAHFREQGLPSTRLEAWRFTDLSPLSAMALVAPPEQTPTPGEDALHHALDLIPDAPRLVFAGGRLCPELSRTSALGSGVTLRSLAEVIETDPEQLVNRLGRCVDPKARALTALNIACTSDGAFVEITPGTRLKTPLHLVFVELASERPVAAQPRNLIVAGSGSRAVIVEHYVGAEPGGGLTNALCEVIVEPGAELDHLLLQEQPEGSFHLEEVAAQLAAGSVFRSHSIAIGAKLARVEVSSVLEGEGAQAELLGAYLARDRQHQDHYTTIDHAAPHTTSREVYKGVLDDRGRGVFHGRVHVRPDAQKIDASQTNRTLLLSDRARINTKPQLEIYADDVRCSHGATVGQLDPQQLFYLRTRGIPLQEARAMLTAAFVGEVISEIPVEAVRAHLDCLVLGWMERGRDR